MPIPLVCIVLAILALLATGAVVVNWDNIVILLKGKRVTALGARKVGKTTLITFLHEGSIPETYEQTVAPEKHGGRRFQLRDLALVLRDTLDVSGDDSAYGVWKEEVAKADMVLYLLRADLLIIGNAETEKRVEKDMKHIGEWLKQRDGRRPLFFIVGTHCDLDKDFKSLSPDSRGTYMDKFAQMPVVKKMILHAGGQQQVKVILGSTKTKTDTEVLVYTLFSQVES
jgi:GTPase SAR1 family protein